MKLSSSNGLLEIPISSYPKYLRNQNSVSYNLLVGFLLGLVLGFFSNILFEQ